MLRCLFEAMSHNAKGSQVYPRTRKQGVISSVPSAMVWHVKCRYPLPSWDTYEVPTLEKKVHVNEKIITVRTRFYIDSSREHTTSYKFERFQIPAEFKLLPDHSILIGSDQIICLGNSRIANMDNDDYEQSLTFSSLSSVVRCINEVS